MRIRRIYLTAIVATAPVAAAIFAAFIASPPNVHLNADHDSDVCVGGEWVSACGSVDVPNVNAVDKVIPDIPVPNINVPNINPGHVGMPGRGR